MEACAHTSVGPGRHLDGRAARGKLGNWKRGQAHVRAWARWRGWLLGLEKPSVLVRGRRRSKRGVPLRLGELLTLVALVWVKRWQGMEHVGSDVVDEVCRRLGRDAR